MGKARQAKILLAHWAVVGTIGFLVGLVFYRFGLADLGKLFSGAAISICAIIASLCASAMGFMLAREKAESTTDPYLAGGGVIPTNEGLNEELERHTTNAVGAIPEFIRSGGEVTEIVEKVMENDPTFQRFFRMRVKQAAKRASPSDKYFLDLVDSTLASKGVVL